MAQIIDKFEQWARSPDKAEERRCENAIEAVRNAISNSEELKNRKIKVFVQGSYRNRVNVRKESDVDIGVMCHDYFLVEYPNGKSDSDFGNKGGGYSFKKFKDDLEIALVSYFGNQAVHRGNKAFDLKENNYHVEADVAPFFEHRHYFDDGTYYCGVGLVPDKGIRIENYPEILLESWPSFPQHYENGVSKNQETRRAYKGVVRILKHMRNSMEDIGISEAKAIPGFLVECLTWNVPNECFNHANWDARVQEVLLYLWSNTKEDRTCEKWCEVNNFKYLFHSSQKWTRSMAHAFIDAAWDYVGVR